MCWTILLFTQNLLSQNWQKCLKSLWFTSICSFNRSIDLKVAWQISQLNVLLLGSCTLWIWTFSCTWEKKDFEHESHIAFFNFWWTLLICVCNWQFLPKSCSHSLHWKVLFFSCTNLVWSFRMLCILKHLLHKVHLYFFSILLWTVFKWTFNFPNNVNDLPQKSHLWLYVFSWTAKTWFFSSCG